MMRTNVRDRGLRRRLPAAAVMLVVAVFAAGCGGDDTGAKNTYVGQVNKAQEEFAATFERLAGQITATSSAADDRRTLRGFQKAIDATTADMRAIRPPAEVKNLHADFVDELAGYGDAIAKAEKGLGAANNVTDISKAQADLAQSTSRTSAAVNRTIAEINTKLRE